MKRTLALIACMLAACSSEPDSPDNAAMNNAQSAEVSFMNLRVEEIGPSRAVARFETSIPTSCEADYGLADDALDLTTTDPDMVEGQLLETHQVPFEDLAAGTTYFWRARVEDGDGTITLSEVLSFETTAADTTAPAMQNFSMTGSVANVSSNFGGGDDDSSWGANNAIDGQMSTEWATNGDGDDAMLEIDLGSAKDLTHFAFRSRKMTDGTSIIESVQLRFDGGDTVGPFDTPDPDLRYLFELEAPVTAQMVTIEAVTTTGGNTGAREIELLGQTSGD
jgi:hypothetical protein